MFYPKYCLWNCANGDFILKIGLFFLKKYVIIFFGKFYRNYRGGFVKKKLSVLLMMSMLSCGLLFTGCGDKEPEETTTTVEADADEDEDDADAEDEDDAEEETEEASGAEEVIDDVATALQADGRDYGQTFELTTDDVMQSAFFDMNINSIRLTKELEDYVTEDGWTFMVVNVTIKNTFDMEIPMSDADFALLWGEDEGTYPDPDFVDSLPTEYYIGVGESETGNLIYIIPDEKNEFILEYYDLWDDDFEGNTFNMHINTDEL